LPGPSPEERVKGDKSEEITEMSAWSGMIA
jgi:hypothetical protein